MAWVLNLNLEGAKNLKKIDSSFRGKKAGKQEKEKSRKSKLPILKLFIFFQNLHHGMMIEYLLNKQKCELFDYDHNYSSFSHVYIIFFIYIT